MLQEYFQPIITYLHHHPHSAGIIVFFIACGEALAVIGTIIPGSVTMTAVGTLIGSKVIPAESTLIWAICGAITGDFTSYFIGFYYKARIHKIWPFNKYPGWLEKGEKFFHKHGGKSVIIGRFFGPARSMVPLIAGTLNMSPFRFLLAAVPSASAWAVAYMTPGILLGALSLELPPGLAIEFVIAVLIAIVLVVVVSWIIRHSCKRLADKIDQLSQKTWQYLQSKKTTHWITRLLADPRYPENHRQLILVVYTIIIGLFFLLITINVLDQKILTALNAPIYHLLRSLRTNIGDSILIVFTILGSKEVMLISSGLILIWLCVKRYWSTAVHWLLTILLCSGSIFIFKTLFFSPRPGHLLHGPINSSFPSGHTCLTVGLLGFLATLIRRELSAEKSYIPYLIVIWITALVALSRLWLGAHWLTDVIGSILLGISIILLVTISYRRKHIPHIALKEFSIALVSIFLTVWLIFGVYEFKKLQHDYTLYWPTHTISLKAWQQRTAKNIPLYRINRLGYPIEAFNVEWLGNLQNIQQKLAKQDWQSHEPSLTLTGFLRRLAATSDTYHLPLLPQIYQNQYAVLLMTKNINDKKRAIILRLWKSSIKIKNSKTPLWIGVINYRYPKHKLFTIRRIHQAIKKYFAGATQELTPFLDDYDWKLVIYAKDEQPKVIQRLHWDGKVLLIRFHTGLSTLGRFRAPGWMIKE